MREINPALGDTPPIQLFRLLIAISTHLRTRMDQELASIGLTTQQAAVLTYVGSVEGGATLGAVAGSLGTTHQNARQIVDALRRKGLVVVRVDSDDRRARRIMSTPAVAGLFADRELDDESRVNEWFSELTVEEQTTAVRLLNRVFTSLVTIN